MLLTSIVFPASFVSYLETLESYPEMIDADGNDKSFWPQVYFILYTCSLVGYGASLNNTISMQFIAFFIIYSLYQLPLILGEMLSKMGS